MCSAVALNLDGWDGWASPARGLCPADPPARPARPGPAPPPALPQCLTSAGKFRDFLLETVDKINWLQPGDFMVLPNGWLRVCRPRRRFGVAPEFWAGL